MPFTRASHITGLSGSVLLYKGFRSHSEGKARVKHLGPYRVHVYCVCCGVPLPPYCVLKEDPTQASQQPDCSFITYAKTQTIPDWLQLISSWLRTVALHCFQVWCYCVVDNGPSQLLTLDHKQRCTINHEVNDLSYTMSVFIQHLMITVSGHGLRYWVTLYKLMH